MTDLYSLFGLTPWRVPVRVSLDAEALIAAREKALALLRAKETALGEELGAASRLSRAAPWDRRLAEEYSACADLHDAVRGARELAEEALQAARRGDQWPRPLG